MTRVLVEMEKLRNPNSGLGQVCRNLGEQYRSIADGATSLDFYLPDSSKGIFGANFHYVKQSPLHKWFPLRSTGYDVWHSLHQGSAYMPSVKRTKLLLTVHDLNFLEKYSGAKQQLKLRKLQSKVNRANAITVVSKYTESILREHINVATRAVHVIYNGVTMAKPATPSTLDLSKYGDYFFSIGIVSPKKNFHVLLPLLKHFSDTHLVIAGPNDTEYAQRLRDEAKALNVQNRFHLLGAVSEADKYWLHAGSKAFLFPSLAEGFGLPAVEAMSLGKPVFLSNLTSLPEIGGPEAFYFNSFKPQAMTEAVEKGLAEYNRDSNKKERIAKWTERYSWRNAALAYLDLYKSL